MCSLGNSLWVSWNNTDWFKHFPQAGCLWFNSPIYKTILNVIINPFISFNAVEFSAWLINHFPQIIVVVIIYPYHNVIERSPMCAMSPESGQRTLRLLRNIPMLWKLPPGGIEGRCVGESGGWLAHWRRDKVVNSLQMTFYKSFYFRDNSLKLVPKGPIDNNSAMVQIMAWRRAKDEPSCKTMIT